MNSPNDATRNEALRQYKRSIGVGAEEGITEPGTTDFSFMDSNWSGGVVGTRAPVAPCGEMVLPN